MGNKGFTEKKAVGVEVLEIETKLNILKDALDKKAKLLEQIYNITENQEMFFKTLKGKELDEYLSEAIKEKQILIDKVCDIDSAFISIFKSFKGSLNANRQKYREQIISMQEKIKDLVDMDMRIRAKEERNKAYFSGAASAENLDSETKSEAAPEKGGMEIKISVSPKSGGKIKALKASKSYILKQYLKNSGKA